MGIFSKVESGTTAHRSRFSRSISNTMRYDCKFHELIPVLKRFVLPGDVWRIGGDVLVRFQPMLSPSLTPNNFRVRYFFVPLRLVEENAELIITGSKDGHLYTDTLPEFKNFVADASKSDYANAFKVQKWSFWDYMGVQPGDYEAIKNDVCLPAQYWPKGYLRIIWDYFADENISAIRQTYTDFEDFVEECMKQAADLPVFSSNLAKDYFTSSLPWQLKAVAAPTIQTQQTFNWTGEWQPNFNVQDPIIPMYEVTNPMWMPTGEVRLGGYKQTPEQTLAPDPISIASYGENAEANAYNKLKFENMQKNNLDTLLNTQQTISGSAIATSVGFTADDLRTMMAQTRIFERLARCGSRYTEYLRANFGTAPADDTLQRAQYLGGWKVPIVTTEVLQTAQAENYEDPSKNTPIGTMRGHGITRGGNRIGTFYAKEFGMLFGLAEIRPQVEYTTGIPRELTYKSRFEFFNPSLQHLSEQEVRNGELYVNFTPDGEGNYGNDVTFGFQAYANELRTAHDETVGDLRDSLSYWTQSLHFTERPNLNSGFIEGENHLNSFNAPFAVQGDSARPCIVQFANNLDVYRPMVRYATPGLVDHL